MKRFFFPTIILLLFVSCQKDVYYIISTTVNPKDAGSVSVSPTGPSVLEGTSVTVTAQPKGEYVFTGWSGSLSGTDNPKTISVTSDLNITANFALKEYPLSISVEGEGAVSEKVISTKTDYTSGTIVELTAKAADHWLFDHWEGDLSGNKNPAQITISSAKNVKAVFVKKMYDLTVVVEGEGSVSETVVETKSGSYQEGSVVQLSATPNSFWAFDHWEGDVTGTDNPAFITITSAATVKAVFIEHDPGIVYTETELVTPGSIFEWLGMGWTVAGNLESVFMGVSGETFNGSLPATQELFNKVRAAGFKTVRIPVSWIGQFDPSNGNKINRAWLDRVGDYVHYCKNAGMNAIIDFHCDGWRNSDGFMNWDGVMEDMFWLDLGKACLDPSFNNQMKKTLLSLWTQIARYFRDEGDYLIFQPFNELRASPNPYGPSPSEEEARRVLEEWTQVFVDAVRATGGENASRWLLIQDINVHEIIPTVRYLKLPTDYCSNNRLMVSIHCYEPYLFSHGFVDEWGHTAQIAEPTIWEKDEQYISQIFALANDTYIKHGIPVCLDEMGCRNRDTDRGSQFQLYYLEYVAKAAHDNRIPPILWDFSNPTDRFAFIDHNTGDFRFNGETVIAKLRDAVYNDDSNYTLQSVYDSAPFAYESTDISIPDSNFKKFLLQHFDRNRDGIISAAEANTIASLAVPSMGISSLEGIEAMAHLVSLDCGDNNLSALYVGNNKELEVLNCENNPISSLDVSMLPHLKCLNAQNCKIGNLSVSHNPELISYCVNCNPLGTAPDLSNNPLLEEIHINDSAGAYYIQSNFFSTFPRVRAISFGGYPQETIDLSHNIMLESIWAHDMPNMEELDLSASPHLNYLYIPNSRRLKTIYVHPDLNLNSFTVVKDDDISVRIIPKH